MEEELDSMRKSQVWDLVDLSLYIYINKTKQNKTIMNKWVLKIKCKVDWSIENCKAWLIVRSYTQEEGINYEETFH